MKIAVDLRSLQGNEPSGVGYFTLQVMERLLEQDKYNKYLLYYNAFQKKVFDRFHFVNVEYKQTRLPNRILNFCFKFFGTPKFESLTGDINAVFMPNPNMISLRNTTKLILVIHDLSPLVMPEMYSWKSRIWHWLINIPALCRRADKILAVSDFTKQALIQKLKIDPQKITVGLLGVDHDRYHNNLSENKLRYVRNVYNLPGQFVCFIATLEPRKNLERLIEAFEQLDYEGSLVIIGKLGWKYSKVLERMKTSTKAKRIIYLGYVPEADKPYIIKLSDVFAWPSLYEGFGLPVLEAMAVGVPVLTSNSTSLPEVVSDCALTVNPYQVTDIKNGLQQLLDQPNLRELYIKKGLERAKQFTWEHTADVLGNLLK
jgi:glycosyltransferase involved in cell wall biosynthesis